MRPKYIVLSLFVLLAATAVIGQGPLYDKVIVNLPYRVTINDTVLEPGEYVIRQHESSGGASRVLHIFSDQGMVLETTAMTIPTLDNRTPEETKVILHHIGDDYYFDKVWIQGKNYGYEFVLPENIRMRQREAAEPAAVVARYEPTEETTTVAETRREEQVTEQVTEQAQAAPEPAAPAAPAAPPVAEPEVQAEAAPAPEPAPAPAAPEVAAAPEAADRPAEMPATAGNWLSMLVGGSALMAAGLSLRKFRS